MCMEARRYKRPTLIMVFFTSVLIGLGMAKFSGTAVDASWVLLGLALMFVGMKSKRLAFVSVLAPLIQKRFERAKWLERSIPTIMLGSASAQLMTVPLVLLIFSEISLVSLIDNILVVLFVPIAMALSAIAGVAGMTLATISGLFSWPAKYLLTYMLDVANILSQVPHALHKVRFGLIQMIGAYCLIIAISVVLYLKIKARRDIITPK